MTDRLTKILLAAIALGLWVNAVRPVAVVADNALLSDIRSRLDSIRSDVGSINSNVSSLERVARGTCTNSKVC